MALTKKSTLSLPPDKDSLHQHLMRVNNIKYCQKYFELTAHPSPLGNGWALIKGKCCTVRHSHPALRPRKNIDSERETEETLSEISESEYEETEFEESSDSDLSDED